MKKIIIMLTFVTFSSFSSAFANESQEIFSGNQREDIIRSIDSICGDSWCEGEYNFKFIDFSCDKSTATCALSFHFIKSDKETEEILSPLQVCHFQNIMDINQIKENRFSLNSNFYDELSQCISINENNVKF